MREISWRQQRSPSPKPTLFMLPPLSKFYYGPAQGWGSNESSPSHNGSTGSLKPNHDMSPASPPRQSAGPVTHTPSQASQGWHSPAPSAPAVSQLTYVPYMSNSWALRAGACDTSVNPTWDSGPPESTWSVNSRPKHPRVLEPILTPSLPPRPSRQPDQPGSYESKLLSSRFSATTIDVPLFLQGVAYDPVSAPDMPEYPPSLNPNDRDQVHSPPEPHRFPPPPPHKIPLDHEDEPKTATMVLKRPQYDPQHSFGGRQQQDEQRSRCPHFDPQHSHDNLNNVPLQQDQLQQPTIPSPQFTNLNVASSLVPVRSHQEPSLSPQLQQSHSTDPQYKSDVDRYSASQHLHQSSISPSVPDEQGDLNYIAEPWDRQAVYTPSPEQHAVLAHQDGHSISNTDLSSNTAGKSTPGSQQRSNTSYRESQDQTDQSRHDQEGDDSFYWHSGRSSSGAEEGNSQSSSPAATPGQSSVGQRSSTTNSTVVPHEHPDLPVRSTSLSPSNLISYGASALGFGGPSDWEYFGDYEAEEIDDEELYSRPRPRDTVSATEGSAELPADLPFASSMQRPSQLELPTSKLVTRKTPPMPEGSPVRQQTASNSQQHISSIFKSSVEGDYAARPNPASEQSSTTPRPLSGDQVAPSSTSPEQRPDLDEVIRAWAEAPTVGRLRDDATSFQDTEEDCDEPPDVAEASLASTPRERMFGVDVILKNAPSLPILSSSIEQAKRPDDQTQHSSNSLRVPSYSQAIPQSSVELGVEDSLSEQPGPILDHPSTTTEIVLAEDELSFPGHVGKIAEARDAEPSSDNSLISSLLHHPIPTQPVTTSDLSLRRPASTELTDVVIVDTVSALYQDPQLHVEIPQTVESGPQEAAREVTYEVAQGTSEEIMPIKPRSTVQPFTRTVFEKLSSSRISHDTSVGCTVDTSISQPVPHWQKSTQNVRSECLQGIRPPSLQASLERLPHEDPTEEPREIDHTKPSQSQILEDSKIAQPNVAVDCLPTTAEANDADATSKTLPEKVGAVENRHHLGASVAAVVETSQRSQLLPMTDRARGPYADLDPWGEASLNRFAAMLREEAQAENNGDKLHIFNLFISRESRLRVVLYGTEDELIVPRKKVEQEREVPKQQEAAKEPVFKEKPEDSKLPEASFVKRAVQRANTMNLQPSLKALPALPSNRDSVMGLPGTALAPLVIQNSSKLAVNCEGPTEESSLDGAQYSPGCRPVVARPSRESKQGGLDLSQDTAEAVAVTNTDHSPSPDAPNASRLKSVETNKPAHTPLKYNEPRSEVKNYLADRKSVIRPYATLTLGSIENGSTFGMGLDIDTMPTTTDSFTAPTTQYNPNSPLKGDDASGMTIKVKTLVTKSQHDLRRFIKADFDPLLTVLPDSEALVPKSARLDDLRHVMEAVPDDFSFIHQSVVAWDAKAKKQREGNDRQRHARQMESEQRIDALFDDHEIGYGDIPQLESEFKRLEAARRADEDRSEYQLFVSDVFNLVWTRLHYELDQLIPHYEQYSKLMNDTLTGKDMFAGSPDSLALAPTMSSLLGLHQKIEIRHQKAFEAVLQRDRRLKKTEISPWYTLGNITKVKQLEKQFEDAEKKAIIEYCQQRNTRANRLMDVLDQNTLRGVGANQDYMEAIMKAVRRVASGRAFASVAGSNEPTVGMEEVEKAKTIAALLATSSEQIVQTFHVADMLLNSADYEVHVAKAKIAEADVATLIKLKEERAKEDEKLMRDLEHRLALIREDTRRTNDEIVKLKLFLGVQNGRADTGAPVEAGSESEAGNAGHKARLHKALEEAKTRNASKDSGG